MPETTDLSGQIEKQFPIELIEFIQTTGEIAASHGQRLYLVGGVIRDLLLGRGNFDLDMAVEGEAIDLAQHLAGATGGKIVTHPRFHTATLRWGKWSVDLATMRSETYERPGALPRVKPGSLSDDLFRRDFTVNAMAVELIPGHFGWLIDPYGGGHDLEQSLIRILHDRSFIDDSTRIWRALRYEQRLGFHLEPHTLALLERDIPFLDTVSADRARHELELILKEELPESVLCRAEELKVLPKLHPALKGDSWLAEKFRQARQLNMAGSPPVELYLALLAHRLNSRESEELISRLRLPKRLARTLRETASLKVKLELLADPALTPSRVYSILHGYSVIAITANSLAAASPVAYRHIKDFLERLRYIRPTLTGDDLQEIGVTPGPQIKEILRKLGIAILNGEVTSRQAEVDWVKRHRHEVEENC